MMRRLLQQAGCEPGPYLDHDREAGGGANRDPYPRKQAEGDLREQTGQLAADGSDVRDNSASQGEDNHVHDDHASHSKGDYAEDNGACGAHGDHAYDNHASQSRDDQVHDNCTGHTHGNHTHDHHAGHKHDQANGKGGHHHGHDHHHGHSHGHHHHGHAGNKRGLAIALIITLAIMLLEFIGGLTTDSLALLSDSGHMLSDAGALALSLLALWFTGKPASPQRTYGFHRFEILAACFNAITLFVIAGFIIWEAVGRFMDPPQVASGPMMLVASIGLIANLLSMWSLMKQGDVHGNMNIRSAYLHVIGDALGSVGAMVAGGLMLLFGWYVADPIISVLVALLILKGAWSVLKQTVHILMEGTPASVNCSEVQQVLEGIEGVLDVHDLHIWTITSGLDSLSCHVRIEDSHNGQHILQKAIEVLERRFSITHVTIQVETSLTRHEEFKV